MSEVSNQQSLFRLLKTLAEEPQTLDDIWQSQSLLWQDLGWNSSQLQLWLYCQPSLKRAPDAKGIERFGAADTQSVHEPSLSEEIARIVQSHGKPLPLAQLKTRLPAGLLATEPMLKAAITDHPSLQMVGPMVKLI